jgi:hypothetical protein
MEYDVCVIEVNTSGPKGFPDDEVIEIGICGVDLTGMSTENLYSAIVRYDTSSWNEDKKEYIKRCDITADDIENGVPLETVCRDVKRILNGKQSASYDIRNVFYRYMVNEPWDLTKEVITMPSVCSRLPSSHRCNIPSDENIHIRNSYSRIFNDDPMNVSDGKSALDAALMTSAILMELRKNGKY